MVDLRVRASGVVGHAVSHLRDGLGRCSLSPLSFSDDEGRWGSVSAVGWRRAEGRSGVGARVSSVGGLR